VVLYPENLQKQIDETNAWTYDNVNNGVYKCGFATTQEAYEKAIKPLFESLDKIEKHLSTSEGPFYWGKHITEGDVRLYTTIVRFDPVYVQHFKTNIRDIRSGYPAIHKWLRNLYWNHDAFKSTTQFEHVSRNDFKVLLVEAMLTLTYRSKSTIRRATHKSTLTQSLQSVPFRIS
jgi:glutathionyl-hydroquinone reductase